jgi:hypothetical protein
MDIINVIPKSAELCIKEEANEELKKTRQKPWYLRNKASFASKHDEVLHAYFALTKPSYEQGPVYSLNGGSEECPGCHSRLNVIQKLQEIPNGPNGIEWEKTWNIYCPTCLLVTKVRESEYDKQEVPV